METGDWRNNIKYNSFQIMYAAWQTANSVCVWFSKVESGDGNGDGENEEINI